jgi:hypothetical protein
MWPPLQRNWAQPVSQCWTVRKHSLEKAPPFAYVNVNRLPSGKLPTSGLPFTDHSLVSSAHPLIY